MAKTDDQFKDLLGVEDDLDDKDDATPGDDESTEDIDLETLLKSIGNDDEADDEEDDEADDDQGKDDGAQEGDSEPDFDTLVDKKVTEELNRIIPERLKRDRKTQLVHELEQLTGMNLEQIKEQVIKNAVDAKADELGISEEEARDIVMAKYENTSLKTEKTVKEQENNDTKAALIQVKYMEDKMAYAKKPKFARVLTTEVLADIDKFTQKGKILSFDDGMKYVLGAKLASGELLNQIQSGAENKSKANAAKRKAAPQTKAGTQSGVPALTRDQKRVAAFLGVEEKDYAAELVANSKKKR